MYVADTITNEKKGFHLIDILSHDDNKFTEQMKVEGRDEKESLIEFFRSKQFQLKWIELKEGLLSLNMTSVVDHIETKFLYSQGNVSRFQ